MATRQSLCTDLTSPVAPDATFAWQVHGTLDAWAARIDVKISILLAYQGGGFLVGLTSHDLLMARAAHGSRLLAVALTLLLVAMLVGTAAIVPVLGWNAAAFAPRLAAMTVDDQLEILSRQLVALSRQNRWKTRFLRASLVLTLIAMSAGALAVVGLYGYG